MTQKIMENIGITEDRLRRSLSIARKAYKIATYMKCGEEFARKMFLIGLIHDIGYEFTQDPDKYPEESGAILASICGGYLSPLSRDSINAIKECRKYPTKHTPEYTILNMADMQIDKQGNEVSVTQQLETIKAEFGEHSNEYLTACDICFIIGLTAINYSQTTI